MDCRHTSFHSVISNRQKQISIQVTWLRRTGKQGLKQQVESS